MARSDPVPRMTLGRIAAVALLLSACAGNQVTGWPSRALATDVPDSTLRVWEAVLRAYHADPGPFHPFLSAKAMPVILRERGRASVPAVWAARLVANSVVDGVCDDSAMLNCWSDVHARYLDLGVPARADGDTVIVRIDFTQETTGLCGTEEWSTHQYLWSAQARVVAGRDRPEVVGDSIVSVSDEVSCSIEPMSAAEIRARDRERALRALAGCYQLVLSADSAQFLNMKRSPVSWTDTSLQRVMVDTVRLDSIPVSTRDGSGSWQLSSGFSRDPKSSWGWSEGRLQMDMGNFFVVRHVDLWPTMIPRRLAGRAREFTDSSQEYFYSAQATRLAGACGPREER